MSNLSREQSNNPSNKFYEDTRFSKKQMQELRWGLIGPGGPSQVSQVVPEGTICLAEDCTNPNTMPTYGSAFQGVSTDCEFQLPEPVIVHEECLDSALGDKHEEDEDQQREAPSYTKTLVQELIGSLIAQMQAEGQTPTREELERRVNACFLQNPDPASATGFQFRVPREGSGMNSNSSRQ